MAEAKRTGANAHDNRINDNDHEQRILECLAVNDPRGPRAKGNAVLIPDARQPAVDCLGLFKHSHPPTLSKVSEPNTIQYNQARSCDVK